MQRVLSVILVVAGLALAGWVALDDTGDDVGEVSIGAGAAPTPTAPSSPDATATEPTAPPTDEQATSEEPTADAGSDDVATGVPGGLPTITVRTGSLGEVDLSRPPGPTRINVPALDIDAPVVSVGTHEDGDIVVPEDVSVIGWYHGSRAPAEGFGNTVLIGHVDSRTQGRGAFFDLRIADVGETVTLTDGDDEQSTWRITGRKTFEKSVIPMDDVNDYYGEQRLLLITCTGEFDPATRSYESIIIVEAEPVP